MTERSESERAELEKPAAPCFTHSITSGITGSVMPDHGGADAGVVVKPLEWDGNGAKGINGIYRIGRIGGEWTLSFGQYYSGKFWARDSGVAADFDAALVEAKAAAQADYERRILSAVSKPAPVDANASAEARLREALEFYADPLAWKKAHDPDDNVRVPDFYEELSFGDAAKQALTMKSEGHGQDASVKCAAPGVHPTDTSCKAEPEVAPGPSDRTADVTENELAGFLYARFKEELIRRGLAGEVARALLDAFTVGRR